MKKNKYKKILLIGLVLLLLFLVFYAFYNKESKKTEISVVYIPKIQDAANDFWTTLMAGAEMAAKEYNVSLQILSPVSETDTQGQNELIEKAAKMNPDVLMVSPISYTESTGLLKKVEEEYHIPVVLVDSNVSEDIQSSLIASDNSKLGEIMGDFALDYVQSDSKIAIVSHVPDSSTAMEREQGFRDGLGKEASKIVETVYSYSDFGTAYQVTKELLEQHPDITLIAGLNEYSAVGAGRAIKDMGLTGQICVIGVDNSIAAIRLMEEGIFSAIVIQKPFNMGYLSVITAYKTVKGMQVDRYIDSGTELITQADMYTDKGQKALFSFLNN